MQKRRKKSQRELRREDEAERGGQGYDRALGKMKVTKEGLRPISLHLPCD